MKEELNIGVIDLDFDGIAVSKQKMQPVFLYSIQLNQTWEEIYPKMIKAKDYAFENQELYAVPVQHAIRFVSHSQMTDVAAYQAYRYAKSKGCKTNWYLSLLLPINRRKFLVELPMG